jgi:hypothetical protein
MRAECCLFEMAAKMRYALPSTLLLLKCRVVAVLSLCIEKD